MFAWIEARKRKTMKTRFTVCCGIAAGLLSLSSCAVLTSLFQAKPPVKKSPAVQPAPEPEEEPEKKPGQVMHSYTETPTAKWTDNVPNTVWSPYLDGKKVDVSGLAPGTLVADPNCPEPMKHLFYVPEVPELP